jgi:DNA-binding MarR family transcriptional regulator
VSVEASAWAWEQKRCGKGKLRGNAKLVLLALADHADERGVCWPGRRGIAEKVGISASTVTRLLAQLEAGGLVGRHPRFEDEGRQTSSRYVLPVTPAQKRARGVRDRAEAASAAARSHPSAAARSQEPSVEPSFEGGARARARPNGPPSEHRGKVRLLRGGRGDGPRPDFDETTIVSGPGEA